MAYFPFQPGQQPMSSSQGVVIASDQSPVSVAGTVQVGNFPATQNVSGSVVAFQGGSWTPSVSGTVDASIVGVGIDNQADGATTQNQLMVDGRVRVYNGSNWDRLRGNSSIGALVSTGASSVITVGQGSVAVNIIAGSIAASFTPPANQSVSGTVNVGNFPTTQNISGSVAAFFMGNASVITVAQGSVAAVIIGGSVATATTNSSVMLLNGANTIGSVTTLQGTNPWVVVGSVYGNISGSVVAFQGAGWSGSVAAFQAGTQITSLVNTIPSSVQVGASIMGIAPVTLTANTIPAAASILVGVTANTNGSVLTTTGYPQAVIQITSGPGASITAALNFEGTIDGTQFVPIQGYNLTNNVISSMATVESDWAFNTAGLQGIRARVSNWSVGSITARAVLSPSDARPFATVGSVNAYQAGLIVTSVSGSLTIGAITSGASVFGNASVWLQSTNASVITVLQAPSVVGTYTEDSGHVSGDKGVFALQVRNDTMASITSNDADYSPQAVGPVGENIVANAPITKWLQGNASMLGGVPLTCSVQIIAAQGASVFTYITGVQVVNFSPSSVLVSFGGATSSIIGYTIAPPGSGSNIVYPNALKTSANADFSASVSGTASIYISAQGFASKT